MSTRRRPLGPRLRGGGITGWRQINDDPPPVAYTAPADPPGPAPRTSTLHDAAEIYRATHAERPADACDWSPRTHPSFRCTLPAGHPDDERGHGGHLMDRDLACAWWGTKTTHRWAP